MNDWLESLPFPGWILDQSLKTVQFNSALISLAEMGTVSSQELLKQGVHSWFRFPELHQAIREGLVRLSKAEVQLNHHYYEAWCTPMNGGLVLVLFQEITSVRKAEQFRSDLVANVSHELRTPLTAIKGFTETLKGDLKAQVASSALSHVEVISRNVDRLISLTDDLLLLSRLESEKDGFKREWVLTQEVTDRAMESLRGLQEQLGHHVKIECTASKVFGDPLRLEQVLVNLIGNALRYAPATSGPVVVRWSENAAETLVEVSDSGPGIPLELQDRIFERFFRVDFGRSRDLGGTGLGLSIVKHLVQRLGGTIELQSSPGAGCRFTGRFPKADPTKADIDK